MVRNLSKTVDKPAHCQYKSSMNWAGFLEGFCLRPKTAFLVSLQLQSFINERKYKEQSRVIVIKSIA